jgi:hypothetical protein
MKLSKFIPSFLKKIDRYLLLKYPTIWVTNIHFLLFYGLLIDLILFGSSYLLTEYRPYDTDFRIENSVLLMLIPTIALFVLWFIYQARYNVDKNYGKLTLKQDFTNFLFYWLSTIVIYSLVVMIAFGKTEKIKQSINEAELFEDIKTYNKLCVYDDYLTFSEYNSDPYNSNRISFDSKTNVYTVKRFNSILSTNLDWNSYDLSKEQIAILDAKILNPEITEKLTENQITNEINQLLFLYQKYSNSNPYDAYEVINYIKTGERITDYYGPNDLDYSLKNNYNMKFENKGFHFFTMDYFRVMIVITLIFSMLVWIFKNVHWKNYVAAAVFFIVSPLVYGILFFIIDILSIGGSREIEAMAFLFLVTQLIALIIGINAYVNKRYSSIGVISIIIFQFATPILLAFYNDVFKLNYASKDVVFWFCIFFTIVTLPFYKIFYSQMWAFPRNK